MLRDPSPRVGLDRDARASSSVVVVGVRADHEARSHRSRRPASTRAGRAGRAPTSRTSAIVEVVRLDVVEDRLLAEVVLDHRGHVRVDRLVVGDAVADEVRDRRRCRRAPRSRRPAQPSIESARKCSGSRYSSSTRRYTTWTGSSPAVVRMNTWLSRHTRSRPSTSSTPIWPARNECSKYAALCTPGVSTTTVGSRHAGRRGRAQRLEQPRRVVGDGADPVRRRTARGTRASSPAGSRPRTRCPTACAGCPRARAAGPRRRGRGRCRRRGRARRRRARRRRPRGGSAST